jgi:hypothetical protein
MPNRYRRRLIKVANDIEAPSRKRTGGKLDNEIEIRFQDSKNISSSSSCQVGFLLSGSDDP